MRARWLEAALVLAVVVSAGWGAAVSAGCESESTAPGTSDGGDGSEGEGDADAAPVDSTGEDADGGEDAGVTLEAEPSWRLLDLGEDTQWSSIVSYGVGNAARYVLAGTNGAVCIYDGEEPRFLNIGMAEDLRAAWAASEESLIVAGTGGIPRHWDAPSKSWLAPDGLPPEGTTVYTALHGSGPNDVYLGASDGGLWRYVGGQWVDVIDSTGQSPTGGAAVSSLWVSSDGVAFVAAGNKLVWGQADGWQTYETGRIVRALWGFTSTDVVAVTVAGGGTGDFIYRFSPTGWAPHKANAAAALQGLNDVWGTSATNIFAIGFKGTIIRYMEREGEGLDWGPVLVSAKDEYALLSPVGTPAAERIEPLGLTLRALAGLGSSELLMAVEGVDSTNPELPASTNLLHYRRHPIRFPASP